MIKGKSLLNKQELEYLKKLHTQLPSEFHNQDVNLFYIHKTTVGNLNDPTWHSITQKLFDFHGKQSKLTSYFLRYQQGSHARLHVDNPDTVEGTAVTLIEKSGDLLGGDIIIQRNKEVKTISQRVGQTIYYDTAVTHGVSEVSRGSRIVLITWFRKDTWQK